jgi:hypothetical protein
VVCLNGWRILDHDGTPTVGITHVGTAREAVDSAMR